MRPLLLPIALVAFVSLGLPDGVLGVAWPSIRRTFALPVSQLGVLLTAATAGFLVASFGSGPIVLRLGVGRHGLEIVGPVLTIVAVAVLVVHEGLARARGRR